MIPELTGSIHLPALGIDYAYSLDPNILLTPDLLGLIRWLVLGVYIFHACHFCIEYVRYINATLALSTASSGD